MDCLRVFAEANCPLSTRQQHAKNYLIVHIDEHGTLRCRSAHCLHLSNSKDEDDIPMCDVSNWGCSLCVKAADDRCQLNVIVKATILIDHCLVAEVKCYGRAGDLAILMAELESRCYYNKEFSTWLDTYDIKHLHVIIKQSLDADVQQLRDKLACIPDKNAALQLIVDSRVNTLVTRPGNRKGQDKLSILLFNGSC